MNILILLGALFTVPFLVAEIYAYTYYLLNTGESYISFKKDQKRLRREQKIRKHIRKMITDVYSMSDEEPKKHQEK